MDLLNIFEMTVLSSLIASFIVLMILIIKRIFRNKLNSTFHYYIWLILLIKLIIPFGPQTPLNISNIYENFYIQSPTNEKAQINSSKQLENTDLGGSVSTSAFEPSNKSIVNSAMNIPLKNKFHTEKVFYFIWTFGIVLLTVILVIGHKKLRKIARTSIKNVNSTHKEILYNCMKNMNIRADIELSYSEKISSPSLCGFIKPKILIPVNVAVNICDDEFKHIIMHELTHLKNKDILINWVITLLSIIYWFNPILLYGFHKMRQDCEFCCDGKVLSYLDEGENIQYGNTIIRVLELGGDTNRLIGTTSMVINNSEIKRRIIMISKYKKINIKDILLGTAIIFMIGVLGIAINTSKVNLNKNTLQVTSSKSAINNNSNEIIPTNTKDLSSDNTKPMVPFLSEIVIYNSHPAEEYPSGRKVTDVSALICDKLIKKGLKSSIIQCTAPTEYMESYQNTRNLITKTVKEYSNTILLDIHRDITENTKSDTKEIVFTLAKSNPHYEANKKFVDCLFKNIKNSSEVKSAISLYNNEPSYFNQDLSNNSVLIEIGNNMSSDSDIEDCVNALVSALKDIQESSST